MDQKLLPVLLLQILLLCGTLLLSQTIIPPEGSSGEVLLSAGLEYPDNYEEAIARMRDEQIANRAENVLYLGYQALRWAQEAADEDRTQRAFQEIGSYFMASGQYQRADSIYSQALEATTRDTSKVRNYLRKLGIGTRTGDWSQAEFYLSEARKLIGNDTISTLMAHYHFAKGLYLFESRYDMVRSLLEYQKAKKLDPQNRRFVNVVNHNLANVYSQIGNFNKAETIGNEILDFTRLEQDVTGELFAYFLLGYTAIEQEAYERVKENCYRAIDLRNRTGVSEAFGYIYFLLGETHLAEGQLDSAEYYFQAGIALSQEQRDAKEAIDNTGGLMKVRIQQERYEEAIAYGEEILASHLRPDQPINEELATAYFAIGDHTKAYESLRQGLERRDEEDDNSTNVEIITALLEEQFRQVRETEVQSYEQQLTNQRLTLISLALLAILIVLSVVFYLQSRSRGELKKLNDSLAESNAALQQFAYITSHDLKEPIRNITSFSGLLDRNLRRQNHDAKDREFLEFIISNATVLREIVDSLQIFTKISFGELEREAVPLQSVFETVRDNLQQTIQETGGILRFNNPSQIEKVLFSRPMLILVLQNLIQNGFKYNESNAPMVEVKVEPSEGKTLFTVKDNGVGIERAYFDRIFSPFKTLKNKSITQSSGLGLSICKNILERYDGRIWVDSDGENGSVFSFVI